MTSQLQSPGFSMNLDSEKCDVVSFHYYEADDLLKNIKDKLDQKGYKRMVLDSISMLNTYQERKDVIISGSMEDALTYQRKKTRLNIGDMRELGITTLFTVEDYEGMPSADKVAEFAADGVIRLMAEGTIKMRMLSIDKMRETKIELGTHEFSFTNKGIVVKKEKKKSEL